MNYESEVHLIGFRFEISDPLLIFLQVDWLWIVALVTSILTHSGWAGVK